MRFAVFSDIHGNLVALHKVLDDVGKENQAFICLGDVAWGGPEPSEVLKEVRRLDCPVVMGNTDEMLLGRRRERLKGPDAAKMREIENWCKERLSEEDKAFMRSFKPTVTLSLGDNLDILCYHGSPRSNTEGMRSTTTDLRVERIVRGRRERIFAGGHTHSQMVRRFRDKVIINPGSVGLPFEFTGKRTARNPPWAEYAIIDCREETLNISLRRVGYDVGELEDAVARSGMPHKDWWIRDWKR
jgi:putative phosphoesterase